MPVLALLMAIYSLLPIVIAGWTIKAMAFDSLEWFVEDETLLRLLSYLAENPVSLTGLLQQLIVPIAAVLSGANIARLLGWRYLAVLIGICVAGIVAAAAVSLLLALRVSDESYLVAPVQVYFHGIAGTVGSYLLFLVGIRTSIGKGSGDGDAESA